MFIIFMGLLDLLLRKRQKSTVETIDKPVSIVETVDNKPETKQSTVETVDNTEILKELKLIYAFLLNHDQKLDRFSNSTSEYFTTLLMQNKVIPIEKMAQAKQILQEAIKQGLPKAETVDKLIDIGIPRSTAYKYTKTLQSTVETVDSTVETVDTDKR